MSPGPDDLRALVREVLRDALPQLASRASPVVPDPPGVSEVPGADDAARWVRLESDADLAAFVRSIAGACADPLRRAVLEARGGSFRLVPRETSAAPTPAGARERTELRVERGAVTERHVRDAGRTGATIVAGRGVVLTPLARDRARSTGVDIEREH